MHDIETGFMHPGSAKCSGAVSGRPGKAAGINAVMALPAAVLSIIYISVIVLPLYALVAYSGAEGIKSLFFNPGIITSIKVSISTSLPALLLTFCLGTPAAFLIKGGSRPFFAKVLEILTGLPVVLPPAAAGMALLLAFGRSGPVGALLDKMGGGIVFTPYAVVLAQFFVSSGFYIQVLGTGIGMVDKEIYEVSYILGAGKVETFFRIILPIIKKSAVAGLILSWARSMGEFGATIIFAGNVEGMTRTMPLEIYTMM